MDLILVVKPAFSKKHGFILDTAICDRDCNLLFSRNLKVSRDNDRTYTEYELKTIHENVETIYEGRGYFDFRDKAEEIKSILDGNRVIIFNNNFDTIDLLKQQCKEAGMNHEWVEELKITCCKEKAYNFYQPLRFTLSQAFPELFSYSLDLKLRIAVEFSRYENNNLKLNVTEPKKYYKYYKRWDGIEHTAFGDCISTAFVFNVIEEAERLSKL